VTSQTIEISTPDGVAEAYVARPDDGDHPPVLFYMDAIGLRPRIAEMVERIATWGYTVLAPNVFYRVGSAAELAPTDELTVPENRDRYFRSAMPRVQAHTAPQARVDLDAYLDTLLALPGVSGHEVGVTGYCMGGRLALRAACSRPAEIAAAGVFHAGGLVTEAEDSPHRQVGRARAEVFAGHADHDRSNPPEAIAALESALDAAGVTYTSEVFAGAAHGYTMADTTTYDEQATERHFRELEALFARTIAGPPV
jgi:carboxymethylenebutenolidase